MADRERLIELLVKGTQKCGSTDCNRCKYWNTNDCGAARLADIVLSDGWIRPPCKVGDTVYCINELNGGILKGEVNIVQMIRKDDFAVEVLVYDYSGEMPELYDAFDYESEDFGVDVFAGKNAEEEAEKALKEREKNG